jgi:hypothetical protein
VTEIPMSPAADGSAPVPAMPVIKAGELLAYPVILGGSGSGGGWRGIGWQGWPEGKGGPGFVLTRRSVLGSVKVAERFPLTAAGRAQAWQALLRLDPASAESAALVLAQRASQDGGKVALAASAAPGTSPVEGGGPPPEQGVGGSFSVDRRVAAVAVLAVASLALPASGVIGLNAWLPLALVLATAAELMMRRRGGRAGGPPAPVPGTGLRAACVTVIVVVGGIAGLFSLFAAFALDGCSTPQCGTRIGTAWAWLVVTQGLIFAAALAGAATGRSGDQLARAVVLGIGGPILAFAAANVAVGPNPYASPRGAAGTPYTAPAGGAPQPQIGARTARSPPSWTRRHRT